MAGAEKFYKVRLNIAANSPVPYSQLLDLRSAQTLNERASAESTAEFLKGLPSYNESNFSRFQPDVSCKNSAMKKSTVYLPTTDHPSEQIITTEKTSILLRFLQQQIDRKKAHMKRDSERAGPSGIQDHIPKKKCRLQDE